MKNFKLTSLAVSLGVVVAGCLPASVLLNVAGNTNVFLAGQAATVGCATTSPGCAPTVANGAEVDFVPVDGNTLTIFNPSIAGPYVTGGVSPCATCGSTTSGDGKDYLSQPPATNISSGNNISGIQFTGMEMFLIGVFLGPSLPGAPVTAMPDYAIGGASTAAGFTPQVGQAFFIGDGLTGTGTGSIQNFIVPTGATRLFMGFADASFFNGPASMYNDNTGALAVNVQIVPTPEPGTVILMMVGLGALVLGRKKLMA